MKQIYILAATALFFAACSSDEGDDLVSRNDDNTITFGMYLSSPMSRATLNAEANVTDIAKYGFSVTAYETGKSGSDSLFCDMAAIKGTDGKITTKKVRTWPTAGYPLSFYGVYPYDTSLTGTSFSYTIPDGSEVYDLVTAYTAVSKKPVSGVLNLAFSHPLARIEAVNIMDDDQETATSDFTFKNLKLEISGYTTGTYDIKAGTWSGITTAGTYQLVANKEFAGDKSYSNKDLKQYFVFIPQGLTFTVTYDTYYKDVCILKENTKTITTPFTVQAGKSYILNIGLPRANAEDEITFNATVKDWDTADTSYEMKNTE